MPIRHAVLGLLVGGVSHGYELKASFERAVGPQWGELNIGHLYQILDRLMRDGLVSRHAVSQSDRPDKLVYELTDTGREELDDWMALPHVRSGGYRDDFFLKIVVAARYGPGRLEKVLHVQREAYLSELGSLSQLRTEEHGDGLVDLLIEAAMLRLEAGVKLVESAEDRVNDIAWKPDVLDQVDDQPRDAHAGRLTQEG